MIGTRHGVARGDCLLGLGPVRTERSENLVRAVNFSTPEPNQNPVKKRLRRKRRKIDDGSPRTARQLNRT